MWQMYRKGIMVQFLISLLICLMIFIPACYIASGIFRTSQQAQDNYAEFVEGLHDFLEHGQIGERKSVLLIMDEQTAVVYFEQGAQEVLVDVDAELLIKNYVIHLLKPGQCDDGKNCLCLFRDSRFEIDSSAEITLLDIIGKITVIPQKVVCTNLDYALTVETCSIGKGTLVNSYTCSNGFMIERNLAKKADFGKLVEGNTLEKLETASVWSYYEVPRRTVLYFTKEDSNTLHLIGNYGGTNE